MDGKQLGNLIGLTLLFKHASNTPNNTYSILYKRDGLADEEVLIHADFVNQLHLALELLAVPYTWLLFTSSQLSRL